MVKSINGADTIPDLLSSHTAQLASMVPYNINRETVFGQEYLSSYHKKIIAGTATTAVFTGDSTTAGDYTTGAYKITDIFQQLCVNYGIPSPTTLNHGHSGWSTTQWPSLVTSEDLPANPDLIVVRWGINDCPSSGYDTTSFNNALRSGLSTLRASRPLNSLAIVLMTPNSISCNLAGYTNRQEAWNQAIDACIRQAARDFQCCFIDTYALWQDSVNGADWLNPTDLVHPQNVANTWIGSRIFDVVFPKALLKTTSGGIYNEPTTANGSLSVNAGPNTYPKGISMYKASSSTAWLYPTGSVTTFATNDDAIYQINFSSDLNNPNYATRVGNITSNTWGKWIDTATPTGFYNEPTTANGALTVTTNPSSYPKGISMYKASSSSAWPYPTGSVTTFATNDDAIYQMNFSSDLTKPNYATRVGNITSNTWGKWIDTATPTPIAPTLLNSWVNFGGSNEVAGYYKDSNNVVHLQGLIANGVTTNGTPMLNLPAGYRPTNDKWMNAACNASPWVAGIKITSTGDVQFLMGTNGWVSLDGITFLATQ